MLQWIEADAAEAPSRIVAAQPRDISMRRLMEGNGYNQGDDPGRGDIKCAGKLWRHEFNARIGVGNFAFLVLNLLG